MPRLSIDEARTISKPYISPLDRRRSNISYWVREMRGKEDKGHSKDIKRRCKSESYRQNVAPVNFNP